jgi:hypothetical protein
VSTFFNFHAQQSCTASKNDAGKREKGQSKPKYLLALEWVEIKFVLLF